MRTKIRLKRKNRFNLVHVIFIFIILFVFMTCGFSLWSTTLEIHRANIRD